MLQRIVKTRITFKIVSSFFSVSDSAIVPSDLIHFLDFLFADFESPISGKFSQISRV
jgi:hypothetical protein